MANRKLPAYFKEYLDEKFNHTNAKINGVKRDVCDVQKEVEGVKKEMKRMNGALVSTKGKVDVWEKNVENLIPKYKKTTKQVEKNRKRILSLGIAIVVGTLFWMKETRDVGIALIASILRGF